MHLIPLNFLFSFTAIFVVQQIRDGNVAVSALHGLLFCYVHSATFGVSGLIAVCYTIPSVFIATIWRDYTQWNGQESGINTLFNIIHPRCKQARTKISMFETCDNCYLGSLSKQQGCAQLDFSLIKSKNVCPQNEFKS